MPGDREEGPDILLRRRRVHQHGAAPAAGRAGNSGGTRRRRRAARARRPPQPAARGTPRSRRRAQLIDSAIASSRAAQPRDAQRRAPSRRRCRSRRRADVEPLAAAAARRGAPAIRSARCRRRTRPRCRAPTPRRGGQAVAVEMPDRAAPAARNLDQGEGRARHLVASAWPGADEGAGEAGLAGAERARQRDHVAGRAQARASAGGQRGGGGFSSGRIRSVTACISAVTRSCKIGCAAPHLERSRRLHSYGRIDAAAS